MSELRDHARGRFGKIDSTRPRRSQNHAEPRSGSIAQKTRGALTLVGRGFKTELDRRRRQSERIAECLILKQLETHVRLRLDVTSGEKMVPLLGIGGIETDSIRCA